MASEHLDNRDTGSTGSPISRAVRAIQAPSIEVGGHTDDDFDISSIEGDDGTTSLASSILSAQADEHGHRYAVLRDVRYPMPIDEIEQNREDLKHSMLMMLTENKLFFSPIGDHPQKILDIGTGTGEQQRVWWLVVFLIVRLVQATDEKFIRYLGSRRHVHYLVASDAGLTPIDDHSPRHFLSVLGKPGLAIRKLSPNMGDRYPSAKVRGIDIAPIQPKWVPPNVSFIVDDCELDWIERDVDLAHFRFTIVILKNTSQVLGHAFESLRPGGWIELQEFLPTVLCDDGTMPDDDPVKVLYEKIERSFEKFGLRVTLPPKLEPYLREAGFENIHCQIMKVPIGPWAKDNTMRIIGLYQKLSVREVMPSLSGRPFQALGMSEAEVEVTIAMARKGLEDPNVHRYFNYYFWYAQKPASSVGE
ncbi:hypothetical protein E4U32_004476 [Claviceps aff. humidiphila group G2b]|nr:hypothetical protein E4U32_004476 [Claviceps aff. humidiphila group G2b]